LLFRPVALIPQATGCMMKNAGASFGNQDNLIVAVGRIQKNLKR
jgi:hypothetical protein